MDRRRVTGPLAGFLLASALAAAPASAQLRQVDQTIFGMD